MPDDNSTTTVSAVVSTTKTDYYKYKKQNSNKKENETFSSEHQNELIKNTSEQNTIHRTIEKFDLDLQDALDLSHSLIKTQRAFLYK